MSYEQTIKELESNGVESQWIKGIVVHIEDIFSAGKNSHIGDIYDYLQILAFTKEPPYHDYSVHYRVLEPHNNHEVLICVWIEEE